jgi:hypothetical protein
MFYLLPIDTDKNEYIPVGHNSHDAIVLFSFHPACLRQISAKLEAPNVLGIGMAAPSA